MQDYYDNNDELPSGSDLEYNQYLRSFRQINTNKPHNKDEFLDSIYKTVGNLIKNEFCLEPDTKILCAVSGGVDSVTMLDCLVVLSKQFRLKLAVAHFNHLLRRKASDEDQELVRKLAEQFKLPFYASSANVKEYSTKHSLTIEQAARICRYKFFERMAHSVGANYIATAHTADDSAETFLINLIRGSGLTGLSGIPQKRLAAKNLIIIRPFLDLHKADLKEYAKRRQLTWREDETNNLLLYLRNKVRHELLPKLESDFSPAIVETLNRTASLLRGADNFVSEYVRNQIGKLVKHKSQDRVTIDLPVFDTYPEFIQGEILQAIVAKYFDSQPLPLKSIDRIIDLPASQTGSICEINKTLIALRDRSNLIISIKKPTFTYSESIEKIGNYTVDNKKIIMSEVKKGQVKFSDDPNLEYFDYDLLPSMLTLRRWEPGDSIQPLGLEGSVKVSDLLIDYKIPLIDKQYILALATKTDIVWVVGIRMSDRYKVTAETKRFIKAELIL